MSSLTEVEWLTGTDPRAMLEWVLPATSTRKLRLFGAACCRHLWHALPDERSRSAVAVAEAHADGLADDVALAAAHQAAIGARQRWIGGGLADLAHQTENLTSPAVVLRERIGVLAFTTIKCAVYYFIPFSEDDEEMSRIETAREQAETAWQVHLLRELFGNPFRPATVEPAWLTSTVVSLATAIDDERAFDRLPILADALEDAGCTNADILKHCRQPGDHVRGCWAVDLVVKRS